MHYEQWLSLRYAKSSKGRFLTFLNIVSITGVAIGVAALIVVIGVMTGFGNIIRDKIIGTTSHIVIEKEVGIAGYEKIREKVLKHPRVEGVSPFIQDNLFMKVFGQASGVLVRGVDPQTEASVTQVNEYLKSGSLSDLSPDTIIIGQELARYYGLAVGDDVTLLAPRSGLSGTGWDFSLRVAAIFETGQMDYDRSLVIVHLQKAQEIFRIDSELVTGISVKIDDVQKAEEVKVELYQMLGMSFLIKTWIDMNRNLFDALWLEKWGLFIILCLMVLVAAFNIISTLIVTVTSKVHDIGILKSIGVTKSAIMRIFIKLGLYIGISGTFWGVVAGLLISYGLHNYFEVPQEIYAIDKVPLDLQMFDMMMIVSAAVLITFFATIYPAAQASKLEPVEALRYE